MQAVPQGRTHWGAGAQGPVRSQDLPVAPRRCSAGTIIRVGPLSHCRGTLQAPHSADTGGARSSSSAALRGNRSQDLSILRRVGGVQGYGYRDSRMGTPSSPDQQPIHTAPPPRTVSRRWSPSSASGWARARSWSAPSSRWRRNCSPPSSSSTRWTRCWARGGATAT